MVTITALERLKTEKQLQDKILGKIALLCHSASVDSKFNMAVNIFQEIYGERFIKIFGPQHGFVTDVQDNMIETDHYIHPYFKLPVYSLYSETREPTDEMLAEIDTFVIDLQDVGTRVYTYITTMTYILKACAKKNIKVVILDRPNPVGGGIIEGHVLRPELMSFVGCMEIPQRHGMTMGEVALFAKNYFSLDIDVEVIEMKNWKRNMFWQDTGLAWVNPSPNLPTADGAITFCGTVLFEGTNLSEGRGTTRSLEVVGHKDIEPYSFYEKLQETLKEVENDSFILRPLVFMPTFQKFAQTACGGVHIHVTNPQEFKSWEVGQYLCREFYHHLKDKFEWTTKAYEYEYDKLPIDLINGDETARHWVENNGTVPQLLKTIDHASYIKKMQKVYLY
jgi:uncharacterized protein YbbC (DUF1343 family)